MNVFRFRQILKRLRDVPVFSQRFTGTTNYLANHPDTVFVRYDDYRFLERKYQELLTDLTKR